MAMFLILKNSHCDLDLSPRTLKLELVQDIVILEKKCVHRTQMPPPSALSDRNLSMNVVIMH